VCSSARIVPRSTAGAVASGASGIAVAVAHGRRAVDNEEIGRLRPAVLVVPERWHTRLVEFSGRERSVIQHERPQLHKQPEKRGCPRSCPADQQGLVSAGWTRLSIRCIATHHTGPGSGAAGTNPCGGQFHTAIAPQEHRCLLRVVLGLDEHIVLVHFVCDVALRVCAGIDVPAPTNHTHGVYRRGCTRTLPTICSCGSAKMSLN
jgi:hypothetical protein